MALLIRLRPYQVEAGRAVLKSALERRGDLFLVEIARQGGKNELSAHLEMLLLVLHLHRGGTLVKTAPTFLPQAQMSLQRLTDRLDGAGLRGLWRKEGPATVRLGRARVRFLSADRSARVLGATADLLLEVDEAQEVDRERFWRDFRPMASSANAPTVLYGTPWAEDSLLEEVRALCREAERRDGVRRWFRYDWEEVARWNPLYRAFVEAERARLGEEHPLFRTQYRLLPLPAGASALFSPAQRALLQGEHPRRAFPEPGKVYVAGVDLAGGAEGPQDSALRAQDPHRDSTVVTIGELDFSRCDDLFPEPAIRVVEHIWWTGRPLHEQARALVDLLKHRWRCRRVVVDATGLGAGVASLLERAMGRVVEPFVFSAPAKSRLAFDLLSAVNAGRLKVYAPDGSEAFREFWRQVEGARARYRPDRQMDFFVDPSEGHDDFLVSLALLVRAGDYLPRTARGRGGTLEPVSTGR